MMRRELGMLAAVLCLCGILWLVNDKFIGESNVFDTGRQIAMLAILSVGSAFVIITGGIDLSVGSIVGLTGVLIARLSSPTADPPHHSLAFGITVALLVAAGIGLVQGLLITGLRLQPFIVTLSGMLTIRGVSQTIAKGGSISFGESEFPKLADLGFLMRNDIPRLPYVALIAIAVLVLCAYVLHFTVFGRYLYAIGGNRDAAEYSGVPVRRVETVSYVISATLAGVAGVCWAAYIQQMDQNVGMSYELSAIAACVLGGCSLRGGEGTVVGVLIGTAMMCVIANGLDMFQVAYKDADGNQAYWNLDPNWKNIVIGLTILLAVLLDRIVDILHKRRRVRSRGGAPIAGTPPPIPTPVEPA